jgi:threonine/homoserine/homoserine lactone efflux protein
MLQAFLNGYASGFVMSLMLGTVFFALIQHSIDYGFKTGIFISLGVIISDFIFVSIAVFGISLIPAIKENENNIRVLGGIVLLFLGLNSWRITKPKVVYPASKGGTIFYFIGKGFLLNALNPVNLFTWVAISTYLNGVVKYSVRLELVYFVACLLAIFVTEILISFGASRLRHLITERILIFINRLAGSVFIGAGLYLFWQIIPL